jgi:hypothetical protein
MARVDYDCHPDWVCLGNRVTAATLSAGLIPKHVCQAPRRLLSTIAQRAEAYPFSARSLSSKNDGAVYGWMCSVGFDAA